jgi:hypothetical protein
MKKEQRPVDPSRHDLYLAKINDLIENGQESLIWVLVDEFDELHRAAPVTTSKAA